VILKGADGVVFVADSQKNAWTRIRDMINLHEHLKGTQLNFDTIP